MKSKSILEVLRTVVKAGFARTPRAFLAALSLATLAGLLATTGCESTGGQSAMAPAAPAATPASPAEQALEQYYRTNLPAKARSGAAPGAPVATPAPTIPAVQSIPAVATPVTPAPAAPAATPAATGGNTGALVLKEGDEVKISFPGSPNLDKTLKIQPDGMIAPAMVGEVKAAGLTAAELEAKLKALYDPILVSKELTVAVSSSSFGVSVTGAVLRPAKMTFDRPVTVLEAIMESGGYDSIKANMKKVKVIRSRPDGRTDIYLFDIKSIIDGKRNQPAPFWLKDKDIIVVPERLVIFG